MLAQVARERNADLCHSMLALLLAFLYDAFIQEFLILSAVEILGLRLLVLVVERRNY